MNEGSAVTGCYLNTDPTGTRKAFHSEDESIFRGLGVSHTRGFRLGGDGPEERNVISGSDGIEFRIEFSGGFEIVNNIIGLYKTGTRDISSASFSCMKIGYNPPQPRVRTSSYR